jgi:hypothetical protein
MITTPPRGAVWLIKLFVPIPSTDPVLGDLEEEFASRLNQSGPGAARRWYWRQALSAIAHLVWESVRAAPSSTVRLVSVSLLAATLADFAVRTTVHLVLNNGNARDYVAAYVGAVWFWRAVDVARFVALPLALGWSIAAMARGRELVIAALIAGVLVVVFVWNLTFIVQRGVSLDVIWRAPLAFEMVQMGTTFPMCVLAGAMIRRIQQTRTARLAV